MLQTMKTMTYRLIVILNLLLPIGISHAYGQDVYEYAILSSDALGFPNKIQLSITGQPHQFIEVPKAATLNGRSYDASPAVDHLARLSAEGWEVYNATVYQDRHFFYLKRRKP